MSTPRYLRFARSLALCGSLAALPGCPSTTGTDAGGTDAPSGTDTPVTIDAPRGTDAPIPVDAPSGTDSPMALVDAPTADVWIDPDVGDCSTCDCGFLPDAGLPSCESTGMFLCCVAVGPLAPPELPA